MPTYSVPAGQQQVVPIHAGRTVTVSALPGGGGSALVESSITPEAAQAPASSNWFAWDKGAVTAAAQSTLYGGAVALRLSATTQAAVFEVLQ